MISFPAAGLYDANDPSADVSLACSQCGHEGLSEDDATEVEGETMCRGCSVSWLMGLAEIVLGHDYRTASRVEAAKRLDLEMVTVKALMRDLERETERLANGDRP